MYLPPSIPLSLWVSSLTTSLQTLVSSLTSLLFYLEFPVKWLTMDMIMKILLLGTKKNRKRCLATDLRKFNIFLIESHQCLSLLLAYLMVTPWALCLRVVILTFPLLFSMTLLHTSLGNFLRNFSEISLVIFSIFHMRLLSKQIVVTEREEPKCYR